MARELITSWNDYQSAIDRLLSIAEQKICIYDEDIVHLKLESTQHLTQVSRVLHAGNTNALQVIVRNGNTLSNRCPLLIKLLSDFGHLASAQQSPPHLAHLRDSMLIVDDRHALIRFERDFPRSKLLIDEIEELEPYRIRFSELLAENGELIGKTTLGL
jgi:hypothetical protein